MRSSPLPYEETGARGGDAGAGARAGRGRGWSRVWRASPRIRGPAGERCSPPWLALRNAGDGGACTAYGRIGPGDHPHTRYRTHPTPLTPPPGRHPGPRGHGSRIPIPPPGCFLSSTLLALCPIWIHRGNSLVQFTLRFFATCRSPGSRRTARPHMWRLGRAGRSSTPSDKSPILHLFCVPIFS